MRSLQKGSLGLVATLCVLAVGCESEAAGHCGTRSVSAPLFGASTDPFELEAREQNAVVALTEDAGAARAGLCSGVLIGPRRVLTARHCAELLPSNTNVFVGPSVSAAVFSTAVLDFVEHETYDVAIAELEEPVPGDLATPLEPIDSDAAIQVGMLGTLVGYGLTEDDRLGVRLFLQEPIVEVDADFVTVDGNGQTGACVGDSGGPLLVRDEQGRHRIAGVLSAGSASCLGIDLYQRLEMLSEWLRLADDGC